MLKEKFRLSSFRIYHIHFEYSESKPRKSYVRCEKNGSFSILETAAVWRTYRHRKWHYGVSSVKWIRVFRKDGRMRNEPFKPKRQRHGRILSAEKRCSVGGEFHAARRSFLFMRTVNVPEPRS